MNGVPAVNRALERAWHQRWWAVTGVLLSVLLTGCVLGGALAVVTVSGDGNADGAAAKPDPGGAPGGAAPSPRSPGRDVPDGLGPGAERTGVGPAIVPLALPPDGLHIVTLTHSGDGAFHARLLDQNGEFSRSLSTASGDFTGTYPMELRAFGAPGSVDIVDGGTWTVRIDELAQAPQWPEQTSGTHPVVLLVDQDAGVSGVTVSHQGESNVFVWGHVENEYEDLMVNEIGEWSGELDLRPGTFALEIDASGPWSIEPA